MGIDVDIAEVSEAQPALVAGVGRLLPQLSRRTAASALAGCMLMSAICPALAQTKITRPVRLIVPYAPGGGTDTTARLIAPYIAQATGQPVVVDNRGGAGSTIGTDLIAKATPDGHTIGMIDSAFVINPGLPGKLPYDTLKDFAPIALVRSAPLVLLVNPAIPAPSLKAFVDYAKTRAGALSYGSAGSGSGIRLAAEQFRLATGLEITHIAYKGGGPMLSELIGGQITMAFMTAGVARPHIASGRLRALAISGPNRSPVLPDVISFGEAGLPSVNAVTINGLIAPAATPRDYVARLNEAVNRVLASRELEKKLPDLQGESGGGSPEDFARFIRSDVAKWQKLIRDANIKAD
jgi:tripartite-type tricarboxylate transporter receptor subunit TctC